MELEIIEHKYDLCMLYYISIESYNVVKYGYKIFVGIYLRITLKTAKIHVKHVKNRCYASLRHIKPTNSNSPYISCFNDIKFVIIDRLFTSKQLFFIYLHVPACPACSQTCLYTIKYCHITVFTSSPVPPTLPTIVKRYFF